jgi:hypothetical protein
MWRNGTVERNQLMITSTVKSRRCSVHGECTSTVPRTFLADNGDCCEDVGGEPDDWTCRLMYICFGNDFFEPGTAVLAVMARRGLLRFSPI